MIKVLSGECSRTLKLIPDSCVQCCVTSPPYFGLRDYGIEDQIGLEETPEEYIRKLVIVFQEVKRVLKDDGTLWLNIGDSYSGGGGGSGYSSKQDSNRGTVGMPKSSKILPAGNLFGIPWMLAFALRSDGWYLRQDIIWHKPNPMPESVKNRCTKAHEYIFLLSKTPKYYFNSDAIKEPAASAGKLMKTADGWDTGAGGHGSFHREGRERGKQTGVICPDKRNRRSVWTVATRPYKGAHFATFPPDLVEPCILAGSKPDDIVLDPFGGSGTVGGVCEKHGRHSILCELNQDYIKLIDERVKHISGKEVEIAII